MLNTSNDAQFLAGFGRQLTKKLEEGLNHNWSGLLKDSTLISVRYVVIENMGKYTVPTLYILIVFNSEFSYVCSPIFVTDILPTEREVKTKADMICEAASEKFGDYKIFKHGYLEAAWL